MADEQAPQWYTKDGTPAEFADWQARRHSLCFWIACIPVGLSWLGLYTLFQWARGLNGFYREGLVIVFVLSLFAWPFTLNWFLNHIDLSLPKHWPKRHTAEEFDAMMRKKLKR